MSTQPPCSSTAEVLASVTSADGTAIGYRSRGHGPGIVVLHGGMESSTDYTDLADALAERFTVHVPDRRGRGRSGPHADGHGLSTEVDDVRAVLVATGAGRVFGVSSGGAVALAAGLRLPEVHRVAVYEPALTAPGEDDGSEYVDRYERAMSRGRTAEAIVTILKGLRVGPGWLRALPGPLARALVRRFIAEEDRSATEGETTFGELVPTMHYDFRIAEEGSAQLASFAGLTCPVLLLGGSRSPRYLRSALAALEELIPAARRAELRGVAHTASSNRAEGGAPEAVAERLLAFFAPGDS